MNINKLTTIIVIGFIIISTAINLYFIYNLDRLVNERIEVLDVEPEIIVLDSIEYDTMYIQRYDTIRLIKCQVDTITLNDTTIIIDSVDVVVPIELKQFSDTLQNVGISLEIKGFNCEIDNLYIKNFLSVPTQKNEPKRWGLGVQLGVGGCKDGFSPYIGVGLNYNLFSF